MAVPSCAEWGARTGRWACPNHEAMPRSCEATPAGPFCARWAAQPAVATHSKFGRRANLPDPLSVTSESACSWPMPPTAVTHRSTASATCPRPGPATGHAAAIPDKVQFATEPRLGIGLLDRAFTAGVPVFWVTADEAYGQV